MHHGCNPEYIDRNFGGTLLLWDKVFGTYVAPERVTITRTIAPAWLLDGAGEVKAEYQQDYELVGTPKAPAAAPAEAA